VAKFEKPSTVILKKFPIDLGDVHFIGLGWEQKAHICVFFILTEDPQSSPDENHRLMTSSPR
jgi:hypothetical protein